MTTTDHKTLPIIGRAERIQVLSHGDDLLPAKIDTGADSSSIWASHIEEADGVLYFTLFAEGSEYYTGQRLHCDSKHYRQVQIANSFGAKEMRYVVKLPVMVCGRHINASFSLADRSRKVYPILLGRRMLANKFLVDVTKGEPLPPEEVERRREMLVASEGSQE